MHGDLASSNVLLTRRGDRGVCERLGVGRLRAKVACPMPHLARNRLSYACMASSPCCLGVHACTRACHGTAGLEHKPNKQKCIC